MNAVRVRGQGRGRRLAWVLGHAGYHIERLFGSKVANCRLWETGLLTSVLLGSLTRHDRAVTLDGAMAYRPLLGG